MTTLPTADTAATLFITPNRSHIAAIAAGLPPDTMLPTPSGTVALWSNGSGPIVLLVHGWSGSHGDLAAFAAPLVAGGFKVISMDLPAHGLSDGSTASVPEMAEAIRAVGNAVGPVHGVIAHSVGCAATALALDGGMKVSRAVFVAPPARYADFARAFAEYARVEPDALLAALRRRDIDIDSIDLPRMASQLRCKGLVVHSKDDKVVPFTDGQAIAAAWDGARFDVREGLGHIQILADSDVVSAATSFFAS